MHLLLWIALCLTAVSTQSQNWGKKVKCFVVDGTVVCPGCSARTGMTCPRRPKDKLEFDSCEEPTTETEPPMTSEVIPETLPDTEETIPEESTMKTSEISKNHLILYLYRYLNPHMPPVYANRPILIRKTRSTDEDEEVCQWNGDCPCPLICCQRGPGCPKRCVMGIKLHPHVVYG